MLERTLDNGLDMPSLQMYSTVNYQDIHIHYAHTLFLEACFLQPVKNVAAFSKFELLSNVCFGININSYRHMSLYIVLDILIVFII